MRTLSLRHQAPRPAGAPVSGETGNDGPLWLCCEFPRLPLEVLGLPQDCPAAVLEHIGGRPHILSVSPAAEALGVHPGLPLNAAHALCAGLETRQRDARLELERLRALAEECLQFTPWVSLDYPKALLLEVRGSLTLFGGLENLESRVAGTLTRRGHACRTAVAPAPFAGWLLASRGRTVRVLQREALRSSLGDLPITALGLEPKIPARLSKAGLITLRDLWRLPRDGLARRYGRGLLAALDRATGSRPDIPKGFHRPPSFQSSLELPAETAALSGYFPAVEALVVRLTQFLSARDAAVGELHLVLDHPDRTSTEMGLTLRQASRMPEHLLALLQEKLERLVLPAPVRAVSLLTRRIEPHVPCATDLFEARGSADAGEEWPRLIEGLEARLGRRAVRWFSTAPDHRPERALVFSEAFVPGERARAQPAPRGEGREGDGQSGHLGVPAARPLWLLPKPRASTGLTLLAGTERIEVGWWDGNPVRRDYRWAVDRHGVRWWVYRSPGGGWQVQGLYG